MDSERDTWASHEVDDLIETLHTYGVLTRHALRERSGAARWPDHGFEETLVRGVKAGRIKALGGDLFEAPDQARWE